MDQAKEKLLEVGYSKDRIQAWKGDEYENEWKELGIQVGIDGDIAINVHKWSAKKARKEYRYRKASPDAGYGDRGGHRTTKNMRTRPFIESDKAVHNEFRGEEQEDDAQAVATVVLWVI